ncbi:MAG: hypothetical protein M3Y81_15140 [Chloroflexota bacterium]|nr:hypothetical protein [Chloroflexota bacterium]
MSRKPRQDHAARSLQERFVLPREILAGDIVALASQQTPYKRLFRAVIRVEGLNYALKSTQEQAEIIAKFRTLLHTLIPGYDLQLCTRAVPLARKIAAYKQQFEAASAAERGEQVGQGEALRLAHLAAIDEQGREAAWVDHEFYLIVPADPDPGSAGGAAFRRWRLPSRKRARQRRQHVYHAAFRQAQKQLTMRVRELIGRCSAIGLTAQRVEGEDLFDFLSSAIMAQRPSPPASLVQALVQSENVPCPDETAPPAAPVSPKTPKNRRRRHAKRAADDEGPSVQLPSPACTQLADLLAPAGLAVSETSITLVDQQREYLRVLVVPELSREIQAGWMRVLFDLDDPGVETSLHIHMRTAAHSLRFLRNKQTTHQASRMVAARRGTLDDAHVLVGQRDVGDMLLKVASGEESLADVSLYLLVRAASVEELEERTTRVLSVLTALVVARPAYLVQPEGWLSCLPYADDVAARWGTGMLLPTWSIATLFPFISSSLFMRGGILLGRTPTNTPIRLDRWDPSLQNANLLIDGPSGYGKSFLVKLMLLRLYLISLMHFLLHGTYDRQIIVTDPDREYKRICRAVNGQWIRLSAGSGHRINFLDLGALTVSRSTADEDDDEDDESLGEGDRLAEKVAAAREIIQMMVAHRGNDGMVELPPEEMGFLEQVIYEAYRQMGITSRSTTHGRSAPLLRDLYSIIEKQTLGPDRFGFLQRLYPYVSGSYKAFFDGPTNVELKSHFLVFDTRDLDSKLAPIILAILSEFVWTQSFASDIPREFVIDEAGVLSEYEAWARFMATIVARARKHWLAVTLILQNIESLSQNRYARIILDNCDTKILLGRTRPEKLRETYGLSEHEEDLLRGFGRGEGLIITPTRRVVARFEANPLEYELATTKPADLAAQRKKQAQQDPASAALATGTAAVDGTDATRMVTGAAGNNGTLDGHGAAGVTGASARKPAQTDPRIPVPDIPGTAHEEEHIT